MMLMKAMNVDEVVKQRYSAGAQALEEALCCPVSYNKEFLKVLPAEILERDYGCGDPSEYIRKGETVLDLGSGAGKICYIASQVVGAQGRVIGVDINDEMLALARKHRASISSSLGFDNVTFKKAKIQDLALDLDEVETILQDQPIKSTANFLEFEIFLAELRLRKPLITSESIDVVVSNCVLNLVRPEAKRALFDEIFRVLKPGGRAVISDIVSDRDVPLAMQQNPELWSGCISGAYREDLFIKAFGSAGFRGMEILKRGVEPWKVVEGIQFWSVTIAAHKSKISDQRGTLAILYKGPFSEVTDDLGRRWERGVARSLPLKDGMDFLHEPLAKHFEVIPEAEVEPLIKAFKPFKPFSNELVKPNGCC
jgi:arsenite methyltransferase